MARHQVPDLRDRIEYLLFAGVLGLLALPSLRTSRRWGRALGSVVSRVLPVRRRVALENIAHAFPERTAKEQAALYRGMCRTLGITLADFARFARRRPDPMEDIVHTTNLEAISSALAGGRGVVMMSAHFGNWEAMLASVAAHGYRLTALGARQRNPLVETAFDRTRGYQGTTSITVGRSLKPVLKALAAGQCVATLADQDGGTDGFFMEFLGREASVQSGLFRLCARKGIPLITGHSVWDGNRWASRLDPPVWPREAAGSSEVEEEARRLAGIFTRRVEEWVRGHPDHWFWVHRRWKTRPSCDG